MLFVIKTIGTSRVLVIVALVIIADAINVGTY